MTPGYFEALGIPLRRGRRFTAADIAGALPVIIINEALARRAFPGEDPIGLLTTRGTIVGTIADVRQSDLDRPAVPEVYYPIAQNWSQISELGMTLVVRTRDRPEPLIDSIRSTIREVNPDQAVFGIKTMEGVVAESLAGFTLSLSILSAFAIVAIVLALSGTYGVICVPRLVESARVRDPRGARRRPGPRDPRGARPGLDAHRAGPVSGGGRGTRSRAARPHRPRHRAAARSDRR